MKDDELRGRLLSHFYRLRHSNGGYVPVSGIILSPEPVSDDAIAGVCLQLADARLIEWKAYLPGPTIGLARITGPGVDAVERGGSASLEIRFPDKPARETRAVNAGESPGATGVLSSWQGSLVPGVEGVLSPAQPTRSLEPVAVQEAFGENTEAALSAPSAEPIPQREILTLKPTFMGMSIDLKELARRVIAWRQARQ